MTERTLRTQKKTFALITGAAGGLGSAFALDAARKGWGLILVDLPGCGLREIAERLARAYRGEVFSDRAGPSHQQCWLGKLCSVRSLPPG